MLYFNAVITSGLTISFVPIPQIVVVKRYISFKTMIAIQLKTA